MSSNDNFQFPEGWENFSPEEMKKLHIRASQFADQRVAQIKEDISVILKNDTYKTYLLMTIGSKKAYFTKQMEENVKAVEGTDIVNALANILKKGEMAAELDILDLAIIGYWSLQVEDGESNDEMDN